MNESRQQKRLTFLVQVILVAGLVLISFGKLECAPASQAPVTGPTQPAKASGRLVFFALQPGTSTFANNVGLSQLVNKYTNLMTTVQPYASPRARYENLRKGNVDLSTSTSSNAYAFIYGDSVPTEPNVKETTPEARFLLGGNNLYYSWVTRPDTGIKTIPDLKGRKVTGQVPGQPALSLLFEETLRAYGLSKEDVRYVPYASTPATMDALGENKVEATYSSIGGAKMEEVATTKGILILPIPPEIRHLLSERPELMKIHTLPAKYWSFLGQQTPVIGFQNFLVCRENLPEETAYLVTKTIIEHAQELITVSLEFKEWGKKWAIPPDFFVPYHPGAIRYFKEQGMWTPAFEARQKEMLEKIAKVPKTK